MVKRIYPNVDAPLRRSLSDGIAAGVHGSDDIGAPFDPDLPEPDLSGAEVTSSELAALAPGQRLVVVSNRVPVPTKDGMSADATYTFPDAKNVGMYTSCKNQGTAWDFLKYTTSKSEDQKLLEITGQMPIRTDLQKTFPDFFQKNPAYQQFAGQTERTVDDPTGPNTIAVLQDLRNFYEKAVISGQGDLKSQLSSAAKTMTTEWAKK